MKLIILCVILGAAFSLSLRQTPQGLASIALPKPDEYVLLDS